MKLLLVIFYNEQTKIFKHHQLTTLDNIFSGDITCALPKKLGNDTDSTKVMYLPNDVDDYKKDSLCLVDITKTKNVVPGLYLIKDNDGALQVSKLQGDGKIKAVGKVKSILCAV